MEEIDDQKISKRTRLEDQHIERPCSELLRLNKLSSAFSEVYKPIPILIEGLSQSRTVSRNSK